MHFPEYIQKTASQINKEINNILQQWSKEVERDTSLLKQDTEAFISACNGGKRIRGALAALGFDLTGAPGNTDIYKIGAAFEIFQTSILAHDDIIDKSSLRRGRPSLHHALGGGHDGISRSLCLGDIGFFLAFKIITAANFPSGYINKATNLFSDTMLKTGIGELLDVELSISKDIKISLQDINAVNRLKTAYYTIASPLMIGAILGGADEELLNLIKKYGLKLGIAFQIKDDLNDTFSDRDKLGKEPGGDIREGKHTLLFYYALENAASEHKKALNALYGKQDIDQKGIEQIKKIFVDSGAFNKTQNEINDWISQAKKLIPSITKNETYQALLAEMTDFLVK